MADAVGERQDDGIDASGLSMLMHSLGIGQIERRQGKGERRAAGAAVVA